MAQSRQKHISFLKESEYAAQCGSKILGFDITGLLLAPEHCSRHLQNDSTPLTSKHVCRPVLDSVTLTCLPSNLTERIPWYELGIANVKLKKLTMKGSFGVQKKFQ